MKRFIYVMLIILLCGSAYSIEYLGEFNNNQPINLIQTCSNCSFVNITSVTDPDSNIILTDTAMEKNGFRYNYTLPKQSTIGTYNVCGIGDLDGVNTVWCYNFDVTYPYKTDNNMTPILIGQIIVIIVLILTIIAIFNTDFNSKGFWFGLTCAFLTVLEFFMVLALLMVNQTDGNIEPILSANFYSLFLTGGFWFVVLLYTVVIKIFDLSDESSEWKEMGGKW